MSMTIEELVKASWGITEEHGFHTGRSRLEKLALIVSEIGEAIEAEREPRKYRDVWIDSSGKPQGVAIELVDAIIRIADFFGTEGWDMEEFIKLKMEYNKERPFRHGKRRY